MEDVANEGIEHDEDSMESNFGVFGVFFCLGRDEDVGPEFDQCFCHGNIMWRGQGQGCICSGSRTHETLINNGGIVLRFDLDFDFRSSKRGGSTTFLLQTMN
jgi:hypothetical protein